LLKSFDYKTLIFISLLVGLAPFFPEPHLFEKIKMLLAGTLKRPIDIFDFIFHLLPALLLIVKFISEKLEKNKE